MIVSVLRVGAISSAEHQTGALRGEIPAAEWGNLSGANPRMKNFGSRRTTKKSS